MPKSICVFCSSSDALEPNYVLAAEQLGQEIARRGYRLVYGGTRVGLMKMLRETVQSHGGKALGIVPQNLKDRGILDERVDELIVTKDMRERKKVMEKNADAFIVLPGGLGTLEEMFEVLAHKQLKLHRKPVVLLNINHYFDLLLMFLEHMRDLRFAKRDAGQLYYSTDNPCSAFDYLETYRPGEFEDKWF